MRAVSHPGSHTVALGCSPRTTQCYCIRACNVRACLVIELRARFVPSPGLNLGVFTVKFIPACSHRNLQHEQVCAIVSTLYSTFLAAQAHPSVQPGRQLSPAPRAKENI